MIKVFNIYGQSAQQKNSAMNELFWNYILHFIKKIIIGEPK